MRCPYTLYKEKNRHGFGWYARFWDEEVKRYSISRSLGILIEGKPERRREAEEKARNLVPKIRDKIVALHAPKRKTMDMLLVPYVLAFWTPESPYVKECATIKKKPLSTKYVKTHHDDTRHPFWEDCITTITAEPPDYFSVNLICVLCHRESSVRRSCFSPFLPDLSTSIYFDGIMATHQP